MKILGGHILKRAMQLTGSERIGYSKFCNKETNSAGYDVPVYSAPIFITAQPQAVSRSQIAYNGLDFERDYMMFYTESPVNDLHRDGEADRLFYDAQTFEVVANTAWRKPQGFVGVMAVRIVLP
jgi:hypothetical protein